MDKNLYYIDWADSSFPRIKPYSEGHPATPITFAEAKTEIIRHFTVIRDHARMIITETRSLREGQFREDA